MTTTQAPPQSTEAEEAILGATLLSPQAIENAAEIVRPSDFYRESHRTIYRAAIEMHEQGKPVDVITLIDELEARKALEDVGGRARILELATLVPTTANVAHYARIVRDAALQRSLVVAGGQIAALARQGEGDTESLVVRAEEMLARAIERAAPEGSGLEGIEDELDQLLADIAEVRRTGEAKTGMPTGFTDLDKKLGGLHPGQLVLVAARPSMGKSVLCQNIAENAADAGNVAAFYSLEMSKTELAERAVARAAKVDLDKVRSGLVDDQEAYRIGVAEQTIRNRKVRWSDNATIRVPTVRAECKRLQRKHGLTVVVVDYLQLMLGAGTEDNRQAEVAQISRGLKILAKELHVPVIAASQLNRKLESREDKRPTLSDLRDSGALEQDADVVLFLYREERYNTSDTAAKGVAELILAKNRNGPTDTVKLAFTGRHQAFLNLAKGAT